MNKILKKLLISVGVVLCVLSPIYAYEGIGYAPAPGILSGDLIVPGRIVYQTDKYIVCNVFTSTGINACIDLLGSEGGEVYLPEGTYTITTAIVIDVASTTITGAGAGTILDASAGFESPAPVAIIDTNDKDYVTIQNLTIIGNAGDGDSTNLIGDGDTADYLRVENCWLSSSDNIGIQTNGYNAKIINCFIGDTDDRGIEGNNLIYILDCELIDNRVNAIDLNANADFSVIRGNYIENCSAKAMDIGSGCNNVKITNNEIRTANLGFLIRGRYIQCSGNIIYDIQTGGYGISANNADNSIFTNNIIFGTGDSDKGIWLDEADECVVTGNYTDNHDVVGIQEDSDCQNNLIYGNNCQDSTPYILNGTLPETFFTNGAFELVFVDTGTTPSSVGLFGRTAQYVVYVATATVDFRSWQQVSAQ